MLSFVEENYLKAIYHLSESGKRAVNTNTLADEMKTAPASVSDMVKRLSQKKMVQYQKYKGVNISDEGKTKALHVIRKHRLWEVFLVDKLNFHWDEVHEVAEQLEHIKSEKLIKELDRFLDFPKRDPHGDPIPDSKGNFSTSNKVLLAELNKGESGICIGVKDSSPEFLQYLDKNKIALGQLIVIVEKESFDQSMLINLNGKELKISNVISSNLYTKTS